MKKKTTIWGILQLGRLPVDLFGRGTVRERGDVAEAGQQMADFALQRADLGMRVVHPRLDPVVQIGVVHVAQGRLPVDLVLLRGAHHLAGDDDADLADAGDVRVQQAALDLLGGESLREGLARGVDHAVRYADGLGQDAAETDARKHVHVVALAWVVGPGLALGVGVGHGREGRARGEEAAAVGVGDGALVVALRLVGGVGQGEDDRGGVPVEHLPQDLRGEDAADGGQAHQDGRLDIVDDLLQGLELLAVVVLAGKVDLVVGQLVTTVSGDQTLSVDEVEAAASFILGHALTHEELNDLFGNTDTGRASAEEDRTVVLAGQTGTLHGVNDTSENDRTRSLNIIVETGVGIPVALECGEGILEVLELDDDAR